MTTTGRLVLIIVFVGEYASFSNLMPSLWLVHLLFAKDGCRLELAPLGTSGATLSQTLTLVSIQNYTDWLLSILLFQMHFLIAALFGISSLCATRRMDTFVWVGSSSSMAGCGHQSQWNWFKSFCMGFQSSWLPSHVWFRFYRMRVGTREAGCLRSSWLGAVLLRYWRVIKDTSKSGDLVATRSLQPHTPWNLSLAISQAVSFLSA